MAVNTVKAQQNFVANTQRGPSNVLWGSCPVADFIQEPGQGMHFYDDFLMVGNADMTSAYKNGVGQWSAYGSAGATITDAALEGGVIGLQSNGDNEGITLQSSAGSFRLVTTSTLAMNGKLWFEARINRSSITSALGEFFVGLMSPLLTSGLPTANSPFHATSDDTLLTTLDFIGFHGGATTGTRGGPTEVAFAFNLTSGTINYPTGLTTLMASSGNSVLTGSSYVKLGFLFDPAAFTRRVTVPTARQSVDQVRKTLLRIFVNGLEVPTFLDSDDIQNATAAQAFPTGFMCPVIAQMNRSASSPPVVNADWIRVSQIANS